MKRALLALALASQGCTVVGAVGGASYAAGANRYEHKHSVAASAAGGAVVGAIVDVVLVSLVLSAIPDPDNRDDSSWGGDSWYMPGQ